VVKDGRPRVQRTDTKLPLAIEGDDSALGGVGKSAESDQQDG
jgi:hypothetical protein